MNRNRTEMDRNNIRCTSGVSIFNPCNKFKIIETSLRKD